MTKPPTPMNHALNVITRDDLTAWLAEHGGFAIGDVITAVIRLDARRTGGYIETGTDHVSIAQVSAWLDVEWYKRDTDGNLYVDETGDAIARGTASIPLHSWPPLTPG